MADEPSPRLRVLLALACLENGGIQNHVLQIARHIDRTRFQVEIADGDPACADPNILQELQALEVPIHPCPHPARKLLYARNLHRLLRRGPWQAVHSLLHLTDGLALRLARSAGIPVRISHSRNNPAAGEQRPPAAKRAYAFLARRWLTTSATHRLAVSSAAAADLFPGLPWILGPTGIDFSAFEEPIDPSVMRTELGLPPQGLVVGHVGRFAPQKNHAHLLRIFAVLSTAAPEAKLLLVGVGHLMDETKRHVEELGLTDRVIFAGARADIPRVLRAMDLFLLPSLYEGTPRTLLEAQAAGLPCVASDRVGAECVVVPGLVRLLSPDDPAKAWADAALAALAAPRPSASEALAAMQASPFEIRRGVRMLERLYAGADPATRPTNSLAPLETT